MRMLLVTTLVAACAHASVVEPSKGEPVAEASDCGASQSVAACLPASEASQIAACLDRKNGGSLERELGRQQLTRITLEESGTIRHPEHRPVMPGTYRAAWSTFRGEDRRMHVAGPVVFSNCPRDERPLPEFIVDREGGVFVLSAEPVTEREVALTICSCPPHVFGGCGAYMPSTSQTTWVLPEETRFGGTRSVRYPVAAIHREYTQTDGCPRPISPPSRAP